MAASWYANPYSAEIADFTPSEAQLLPGPERMPWPLHQTPCMWVGGRNADGGGVHLVAPQLLRLLYAGRHR